MPDPSASAGVSERLGRRVAAAPISWGVCEVPGWGLMLPPERVLSEMASLGFEATELGPIGYLPLEPDELAGQLARHGLRLIGGFVPLVLHEEHAAEALEEADRIARLLAGAGGELFEVAAVADAQWAQPHALSDEEWTRLAAHLEAVEDAVAERGLELVVHPHAGTLLEGGPEIDRLLAISEVPLCLDTGHLVIAGMEPLDLLRRHAERVRHVHLKDVDRELAGRVRAGELSLVEAVQAGLFRPLGQGDAGIDEVVRQLDRTGYDHWLVLEQDTAITGEEPPVGSGPVLDVQASVEHLYRLAPAKEEVPQT